MSSKSCLFLGCRTHQLVAVRATRQPVDYWLLPSSSAGASGSAVLQCYGAGGDPRAVYRNHPGNCRKGRGEINTSTVKPDIWPSCVSVVPNQSTPCKYGNCFKAKFWLRVLLTSMPFMSALW